MEVSLIVLMAVCIKITYILSPVFSHQVYIEFLTAGTGCILRSFGAESVHLM